MTRSVDDLAAAIRDAIPEQYEVMPLTDANPFAALSELVALVDTLTQERDEAVRGVPIRAEMIGARYDAPSRERPSPDSTHPGEAGGPSLVQSGSFASHIHSSKRVKRDESDARTLADMRRALDWIAGQDCERFTDADPRECVETKREPCDRCVALAALIAEENRALAAAETLYLGAPGPTVTIRRDEGTPTNTPLTPDNHPGGAPEETT